jgi:hypothetical protein
MGWQSIQNGQLLALAKDAFDCLITLDKGIAFQHSHQNIELRILIIRIPDNRKETQVLAVPHILAALSSASAERITHLTPPLKTESPRE